MCVCVYVCVQVSKEMFVRVCERKDTRLFSHVACVLTSTHMLRDFTKHLWQSEYHGACVSRISARLVGLGGPSVSRDIILCMHYAYNIMYAIIIILVLPCEWQQLNV